ncbi:MAG: glycosyltransferase family 4 protein, partial [Acidobacteria bacterium]|nr:glycosyltransferase family 4 protein [Acidobacteriota bacterium]
RMIPQMIRHERIRIVHTFLFDADFYGMLAARRGGPWAIVTTRRAIKRGRLLHLLGYRMTNPFVDRIVCNSEAVSRFTLHAEGASRKKVVVIPNGVDAARFERGDGATMRSAATAPRCAAASACAPRTRWWGRSGRSRRSRDRRCCSRRCARCSSATARCGWCWPAR